MKNDHNSTVRISILIVSVIFNQTDRLAFFDTVPHTDIERGRALRSEHDLRPCGGSLHSPLSAPYDEVPKPIQFEAYLQKGCVLTLLYRCSVTIHNIEF